MRSRWLIASGCALRLVCLTLAAQGRQRPALIRAHGGGAPCQPLRARLTPNIDWRIFKRSRQSARTRLREPSLRATACEA